MSAHMPTPWSVVGDTTINCKTARMTANGYALWIADTRAGKRGTTTDEDKANAAHIVRCVNAHDNLVAALHECRIFFDTCDDEDANALVARINNALAGAA